jgi:curved DNA-binding protein CbpA
MSTHYETLEIAREASAQRVKRSYRSLVIKTTQISFPQGQRSTQEAEKQI